MKTPKQIAIDLVEQNTKLIREEQERVAKELLAKGLNPEDVILEHNASDVIDDPTIPYKITVRLKPRMGRADLTQEIGE